MTLSDARLAFVNMKILQVEGLGPVSVTKRRHQTRITVRVKPDGTIAASIPLFAPYRSAVPLCLTHRAKLIETRDKYSFNPVEGTKIGRHHTIALRHDISRSFTKNGVINVGLKGGKDLSKEARAQAVKALRIESKQRVVARVDQLAKQLDVNYKSISVKHMTSRWGSCTEQGSLNFSIYCAQLDDELLDYIIIHELSHLKFLDHSRNFWNEVARSCPDYQSLRKRLQSMRPGLAAS